MNIELSVENSGLVIVDMQAEGCERHGPTLKPVIKNIRNYFVIVPEDCIHASRADGKAFALSQSRSPAYNFNVTVADSAQIILSAPAKRTAVG